MNYILNNKDFKFSYDSIYTIFENYMKDLTYDDYKDYKYVGYKDKDGYTLLMYYLENNEDPNPKVINLLFSEIGLQNNEGETALMLYLSNRDLIKSVEIVKLLSKEINVPDKNGNTALIYYLKEKNPKIEIVKLLSLNK